MDAYRIGDRRPLASRGWKISERIANWLSRSGATPNAISVAGMVCGIFAGLLFAATGLIEHHLRILWLSGALLVQLRLLANLYDGMVAGARRIASPVGELFNEVPDRVSDAATLIGFGYAAGSDPRFGFIAGSLVAQTEVSVVPCYLRGTFAALPAFARVPRPKPIGVRMGAPLSFASTPNNRAGWEQIAAAAESAVRTLAD